MLFGHENFREEIFLVICGVFDRRLVVEHLIGLDLEKSFNGCDKRCVIRDVSQRFHWEYAINCPLALVCPLNAAEVGEVPLGLVVFVVAGDEAAPEDLPSASLHENDVAGLEVVGELPERVGVVARVGCSAA